MNGAEALVATLANAGVTTCFANPGTSEMHFVAALDTAPEMRGVLCLFEGVATGAADGYGRMAGRPAATLLHLGPGLANGLANLHNARRAHTPLVNLVGDHATFHKRFDAPLESDIDALAGTVSSWVRRPSRPEDVGPDTAEAVAAARAGAGSIATLILPADVSWEKGAAPSLPAPLRHAPEAADAVVAAAAAALVSGEPAVIVLGGPALREPCLSLAAQVAAATGALVLTETFGARLERGTGRPAFERVGYFAEQAGPQFEGIRHVVLIGAPSPVAFFAYPGRPSALVPSDCSVQQLAGPDEDVAGTLEELVRRIGAPARRGVPRPAAPAPGAGPALTGPLTPKSIGVALNRLLPEGAIVVDEAITAGLPIALETENARPHDWLALTGGAIGQGLPAATGAATACPDRRVVCLQADGSSLYTIQALWTQAREGLPVTTVFLANRSYAILQIEMHRMREGAGGAPGPTAASLLDLSRPDIDAVSLARGFGVPAVSVRTTEELVAALQRSLGEPGPCLVEAVMNPR
jgi:acetolactate synthase I/II/III large subunit